MGKIRLGVTKATMAAGVAKAKPRDKGAADRMTMSADELLASLLAGGHKAALERYESIKPG